MKSQFIDLDFFFFFVMVCQLSSLHEYLCLCVWASTVPLYSSQTGEGIHTELILSLPCDKTLGWRNVCQVIAGNDNRVAWSSDLPHTSPASPFLAQVILSSPKVTLHVFPREALRLAPKSEDALTPPLGKRISFLTNTVRPRHSLTGKHKQRTLNHKSKFPVISVFSQRVAWLKFSCYLSASWSLIGCRPASLWRRGRRGIRAHTHIYRPRAARSSSDISGQSQRQEVEAKQNTWASTQLKLLLWTWNILLILNQLTSFSSLLLETYLYSSGISLERYST